MSQQQLQNLINLFNAVYGVGDKVQVMRTADGEDQFKDTIKHPATIMGGHTAMAWLEGAGSYDLTFVMAKL